MFFGGVCHHQCFFILFFPVLWFWKFGNFSKKREFIFCQVYTQKSKIFQFFCCPSGKNLPQKSNYWHSSHVYLPIGYTINGHVQNYSQLIQKYCMLFFFHCLPLNPFTMNVARTYFDFRLCTFWPNYGQ